MGRKNKYIKNFGSFTALHMHY